MNDLIRKQLTKIKVANVQPFKDTDKVIHIRKGLNINEFKIGNGYEIVLDDILLNPPNDFSFHINWNKGIVPRGKYLKCFVVAKIASIIKVDSVVCNENFEDSNIIWSGWLPIDMIRKVGDL